MATVGYERVLTRGQDLALQHEALKAAGSERIYAEKISGARSEATACADAEGAGARGHRCRHSARSSPRRGQGSARWRAPGRLMLTVLGGLAEFERSLIMARTQAGIQRARERGVAFGRPTKLNAKQRRMIAEWYAAGETAAALAREFEVGEPPCGGLLTADPHERPSLRAASITMRWRG